MYNKHFRFSEAPFSIAPNPRYLYLSEQHREAMAHLKYGIEANGGFILLTGEVGTGKTTVCRCFLEHIPDNINIAIILNPPLSETELLQAICDELKIAYDGAENVNQLTVRLNDYLLHAHGEGQRTVVVVEEAQHLDRSVLERLRLLTNLETDKVKLLQVILIGQPELLDNIMKPEMTQLAQRIIARCHLRALTPKDLSHYLEHRLKIVGGSIDVFPEPVQALLFRLSKGVPRLINLICDRALLGCYAQGKQKVDTKTLLLAAREVIGERKYRAGRTGLLSKVSWAAAIIAIVGLVYAGVVRQQPEEQPAVTENVKQAEQAMPPAGKISLHKFGQNEHETDFANERMEGVAGMLDFDAMLEGDFGAWDAYQSVFEQWEVGAMPAGVTPCEYANRHSLTCWHADAPLIAVMQVNRPAVVKLKGRSGKTQYVALLSFNAQHFFLRAGKHTVRASREQVRDAWAGEYTVLWRRPPGYIDTLRPGYRGEVLPWLFARMSQINNETITGDVYGLQMMDRVRRLQRECRLQVDGLTGRHTVVMLNSLTDNAPLLSKSRNRLCGREVS